jgi:hypothetical protein
MSALVELFGATLLTKNGLVPTEQVRNFFFSIIERRGNAEARFHTT